MRKIRNKWEELFMFLSKEEKVLVLMYRVQKEREVTLMGGHTSYDIGEKRIKNGYK